MITIKIKESFFDRAAVIGLVTKEQKKALSKSGAYIMTAARRSMRKRKKASKPGSPPSSHTGKLRNLVLFGYDAQRDSVIVGPVGFSGSVAPQLLEHGGYHDIFLYYYRGKKVYKRVYVRPRPYMAPALASEIGKIPERWRNSIKTA